MTQSAEGSSGCRDIGTTRLAGGTNLRESVAADPQPARVDRPRMERSLLPIHGIGADGRSNAPGRNRTPQVRIRSVMVTSAKWERGPTKQHRVRIQPSERETAKIRFGFASGTIRHERPIGPERVCWSQKCSTNRARLCDGEKSLDGLAAAPDWSRRIRNG